MTEAFRSAVAYRNDFCATIAQLRQRLTRPLPDGATVYVTSPTGLYRLVKGLGSSFDNIASAIVVPADQSDNRWVLEEVSGASPWTGVMTLDEAIVTTPTAQFAWRSLGLNGGSYSLIFGDASVFQLAADSEITYHGPSRQMAINLKTTVQNNVASDLLVGAVVSVNNDVPDGNTSEQRIAGEQDGTMVASGGAVCLTTERVVLLVDGDVLRIKYRNQSTADGFSVVFVTLSLMPT